MTILRNKKGKKINAQDLGGHSVRKKETIQVVKQKSGAPWKRDHLPKRKDNQQENRREIRESE